MLLAPSRLKRETLFLCRKHKNGWQKPRNSAKFSKILFQLMLDAWQTVCDLKSRICEHLQHAAGHESW